jgi:hypothetical protein
LSGKWRLIAGTELYDISTDPGQEHDIAAAHPEIVRSLRQAQEARWAEVFPETFEAPRPIEVGAGPATLTPLSARPVRGEALVTQRHVRSGQPSFSEWTIRIAKPARLHIEARRWPAEADAPLAAGLPAFRGEFASQPKGVPLPIASLRVRVAGAETTIPAQPAAKTIAATLDVPAGEHTLTARFLDAGGNELTDAYYVTIQRTAPESKP